MVLNLKPHSLPWCEPIDLAARLSPDDSSWILLYSAIPDTTGRQYSYLATTPEETIQAEDFSALEAVLSDDNERWNNAWFGYLGYGLKDCLETLPPDAPGNFALPNAWMCRYRNIYCFDHAAKQLTCWSDREPPSLNKKPMLPALPHITVTSLHSNMTKAEYLNAVTETVARIHAGDFYQANITRKFYGTLNHAPAPLPLFAALSRLSPAPMSALLKCGETYILSSSPELFLTVDEKGHAQTRPIKGSAPRASATAEDGALRDGLKASGKDRAENLMIVDLMRNDLSKTCIKGSVGVDKLFDIESFASVHHMVSTINGEKRPDASTLKLVKGCFPPGSMTGAPKIPAMAWCTQKERIARGVYSGAIGFFGGDGSADLSVVIRTLLLQGNCFEFQVGGGIVADSSPEAEWQEILIKARGISTLLGMDPTAIETV